MADYYKPRGIHMHQLETFQIEPDEMEALRLAHVEKLYQEQAAEKMEISRQTFGRILTSAQEKISTALVYGKAIKIEKQITNSLNP